MRKLIVLVFYLFAAKLVFAAEVGLDDAKSFAFRWRGKNVSAARTHKSAAGESRFHVVSFEGGGWAAVGVDDEESPVIAFSDKGEELVEDEKNPVWFLVKRDAEWRAKDRCSRRSRGLRSSRGKHKGWEHNKKVEGRGKKVEGVGGVKLAAGAVKTSASGIEDVRVAPLITSTWSQGSVGGKYCYNYYTPSHSVCGCVATMMAQVMRYHEWPQEAVDPVTKTCWLNGNAVEYTTSGGPYIWSKMSLVPDSNTADECRQEIGRLCSDCGVANQMSYTSNSSGAYAILVKDAFLNCFDYSYSRFLNFTGSNDYFPFNLETFKTVIITNCDARKPVCLGIGKTTNVNAGHAVVADGYGYSGESFFVHINAGWGGNSNAWYCPPDEILSGGYNVIDTVVYNIFSRAQDRGSIVSGRVLDHNGDPIQEAVVKFFQLKKVWENGHIVEKAETVATATVTTDENGIFAWIKGDEVEKSYKVTASPSDVNGDKTIVACCESLTIEPPSTFSAGEIKNEGIEYSRPNIFVLGNQAGVDFTLDLRRSVPKVLFR